MLRTVSRLACGRIVVAATMLMVVTHVLSAQAPRVGNDSAIVTAVSTAFFDAVEGAHWAEAARLLDTTALESIRHRIADDARTYRAMKPMTVQQLMRASPGIPRAVATYRATERNARIRALANIAERVGASGPDSLLALPLQVFGQRWLEAQDERRAFRESARLCGHGDPEMRPLEPYRVLGNIVRDSVAYVLYDPGAERAPTFNPQVPRTPRVMVLRWRASTWSIIPREGLIGMPNMVEACG